MYSNLNLIRDKKEQKLEKKEKEKQHTHCTYVKTKDFLKS